ncbi:uncharacterized protein LAJ45_03319 [Morchella importuna]|uniref:uncharacterized protein n=1 Tax=Morchella importuna TaxID=1174673 RepID=UPI001E8D91CD|nr:uncharacterized protein LAJ45_03319 [Morchella importuna]KAH8152479.1 hypothetical protein LAJ45_03319 [Morchella importuna]
MSSEEQTPGPAATAEPAMAKRSAEHLEEKPAAPVETVTEPTPTAASTSGQPVAKKIRTDPRDGEAAIKAEFLVLSTPRIDPSTVANDDNAEAARHEGDDRDRGKKRDRGQNKARKFHFAKESVKLCNSFVLLPRESLFASAACEFAGGTSARWNNAADKRGKGRGKGKGGNRGQEQEAPEKVEEQKEEAGGEKKEGETEAPPARQLCAYTHVLRDYLKSKKEDIDGVCPVWEKRGWCASGWRCRWLKSHSKEEDGELMLVIDEERRKAYEASMAEQMKQKIANSKVIKGANDDRPQDWEKEVPVGGFDDPYGECINNVPMSVKITLRKNQFPLPKSKIYNAFIDAQKKERGPDGDILEDRASYVEEPVRAEEKRKLYIGRETPLLAPLTTTGNMPFRRLCSSLGAALTYSEMAMTLPLLQGHKPEWALLKAHSSELPHFGAQICGTRPDTVIRATEALCTLFPSASSPRHGLSLVDLNCGCPIDLVYKQGGGSALLDSQGKLLRMLSGMNYVSGETPITVKVRMGCKDGHPTAQKLVHKLYDKGCVQAITLHGRSRQQRYTRSADWTYIAETAALIKSLKETSDAAADTAAEKEAREKLPVYLVGNGDCYSHIDYYNGIEQSGVDSVMIARGALIKPWIFEEITAGQYLDKSATERLAYVGDFARYGLEYWGADELGVATTRRFLLEYLGFSCRYVPLGILERLPPKIQDRPPLWKGRSELETLMGSGDYRDWIKITEMFLGKAPEDFYFTPKHKSNAYESIEAEG